MSSIEVRPFRRGDRDQLTALVNTHAAAVVPGLGISVSSMLSELERQPGEFLIDPWVSERLTLVAEQHDRIGAAAHLLRYAADERVSPAYANSGVIRWLLFWPEAPTGNPYWSDATQAAEKLIAACLRQLDDWGVTQPVGGGRAAGARGLRSAGPVAARPEPLRAGRVRARRAHRDRLPDPGGGPATPGPAAGRGAVGTPVGRHQRHPAVGHARRGGDRLHRGGDLRGGRAAGPARGLGRRGQPAGGRAVSALRRRYLAVRPGGRVAGAGPRGPAAGLRLPGGHRRHRPAP